MLKFAFISRHLPTPGQVDLAAARGIELVHVGDADAFSVDREWVREKGQFEGVIVVHPAAALRLYPDFVVGVFENANRAPEGERPTFEAVSLHFYYQRSP